MDNYINVLSAINCVYSVINKSTYNVILNANVGNSLKTHKEVCKLYFKYAIYYTVNFTLNMPYTIL